ncbi:MAG: cation diffusion facilitator family transporter [Butyricimonas virosa]|uniref:cation diffusion facilitator family transporter n=1 Tax=Butyricimonas virosa TaxID=544645 RepID=UPI00242C5EC3|nr:cation diffusion facilitator family transporter [Butyricimonas virosa]MDY5535155.1 cation diffusion facilitator family transporter [Butyricimonas virosa]
MEKESREKQIYRVTIVGSIANFFLLVFKFVAGILGQSSAMIADAVHSLSDFVTDIIVLVFVKVSAKPEDAGHDYGHGKYETLATAIIGIVLLMVGTGIFWNGLNQILAFYRGEKLGSPDLIALIAALASIVVKEILYRYSVIVGHKVQSQAVVANAWHHRSDAFSSIGTALGIAGAIFLGKDWRVLDPIAAVIVSIFIVKVSIQLLIPCLNDLLERSLPEETEKEIITIINEDPQIKDPHNLRTRRIGNDFAIEVHIRLRPDMTVQEAHVVATGIENRLRAKYGLRTHVAVHVEPEKNE